MNDTKPTRRCPEDEALLTRAKALLMERRGMTEAEAHRYLQKQSMNNGVKMADTARRVLEEA